MSDPPFLLYRMFCHQNSLGPFKTSVSSQTKAFPLPAQDALLLAYPLPPHSSMPPYWGSKKGTRNRLIFVLSLSVLTDHQRQHRCRLFWEASRQSPLVLASWSLPVSSTLLQILPHVLRPLFPDVMVSSPSDSPLDIVIARYSSSATFHTIQFTPRKVSILAMCHAAGESWLPHHGTCATACPPSL